jgi:solute carrier family 25 citrate transporter 1
MYQEFKDLALKYQSLDELPSWQHLLLGGVSGAMGPMANAPIDTIKTRVQKESAVPGVSGWQQIKNTASALYQTQGIRAFYNGLTPRLLRVAPGQAITFMVYEKIRNLIMADRTS